MPAGLEPVTLCKVSYLRPVENCPVYTEYFKKEDSQPDRLCPIHKGTIRQVVERSFQGAIHALGRKLRGLFGRPE